MLNRAFFIFFISVGISLQVKATSPISSWATDMYNQQFVKTFNEGRIVKFSNNVVTTEGEIWHSDTASLVQSFPWSDLSANGFRYNPALTPKNPNAKNEKSIADGKYMFTVYCAACHGADGKATTKISKLRGVPAIDKLIPKFSEGYIFTRITYGGPILTSMPPHIYLMSKNEIWDVVNYVKNTFK